MEIINQVDSKLEETYKSKSSQSILLKLYTENVALRDELKKMNKKLDNALSPNKPTLTPRRQPRRKSTQARKLSSPRLVKSKTDTNPLLFPLESKLSKLKTANRELRMIVDYNYTEELDIELRPSFEKIQKYLGLIFRAECDSSRKQQEILEREKRLQELKVEEVRCKQRSPRGVTADFGRETQKDIINQLKEKESKLKEELKGLKEIINTKELNLINLESAQKEHEIDIRALSKLKSQKGMRVVRALSPTLGKRIEKEEFEYNTDKRNKPRMRSNKIIKVRSGTERQATAAFIKRPAESMPFVQEYEIKDNNEIVTFAALKVFKNLDLKPEEFEFTHNFTREALMNHE